MELKVIFYVVFTFVAAFGLSGINYNGLFKKGHTLEPRVLVIVLSFSLGYLLTNFLVDFLNLTAVG